MAIMVILHGPSISAPRTANRKDLYLAVKEAEKAAIRLVKPGVRACELTALANLAASVAVIRNSATGPPIHSDGGVPVGQA